ncbi:MULTISPECIES: co-chaperone YbbN [Vibrio]|uniref:Co-chaperone YbbN n=1 Tax=Vibrio kanaloae TaxID=170673 RepID=A0A4U1Z1D3_9VIBR|nr:co-chaperone YbbN [Vibrio kanaloae]KAB0464397.1 co-chaperone YbbN [Vibrio kanaloae]MCG9559200.1 co-chaperone YbbN [Vibrio kanaloae]NOI00329.1 co-chaperone YbbN [Vibrio kanaloae]NOJ00693.1 co-chaperone YbbN [Vibrio kanaloae]OEF12430.1 co-chaperone YbbN [Vibrio kanaloae 5S-149]
MQSPHVVELNEQNFRQVLEGSMQTPVLIHFWAPMSQESAQIIPELQTLTQQYNGAFTLALLNCEQEQAIASQFGVQALPTVALFVNGQPVDGLGGPQSIEAIVEMLSKHLPSQDELALRQALEQMQTGAHAQALAAIQQLPAELTSKGEVKLAIAECLLETQQFDLAETQLATIPLEYQDNYYKGLVAKLELHKQASDSPEIQALETALQQNPSDAKTASELALQYHQVNRSEESMNLLWSFLAKDLNTLDGDMKKEFMDILSALGQGNPVASKYRRQLYSLLY